MTDPFTLVLVFIAAACLIGGAILGGLIMSVRSSNPTARVHRLYVDNASLQSRGTPSAGPQLWADIEHHSSPTEHHDVAS